MTRLTRLAAPAIIAALGIAAAMPAQARDTGWDHRHDTRQEVRHDRSGHDRHDSRRAAPIRDFGIRADIADLGRDINRAAARRAISPREASGLRQNQRSLERLYFRYARNGLSRAEVRNLRHRADRLRVALRIDMHDRDRRRS